MLTYMNNVSDILRIPAGLAESELLNYVKDGLTKENYIKVKQLSGFLDRKKWY